MPSPRELRAAIIENRAQLQAALHSAHETWEVEPPIPSGEEESWTPRRVVEHMVGAEWGFTNLIAQACGAPAGQSPTVEAATPADAAASVTRIGAQVDDVLRHVSDGDLAKTWEHPRFGPQTVAQLLETIVDHGANHVSQLLRASSA